MILLHAVLLFSVVIAALSAPDLSQARARVNEIRARALASRERLRTNAARITDHLQTARSGRSKRQHYPEYAPPPPPQEYQSAQYEDQEPVMVHICSVEDDGYARDAEELEMPKSRKRKPPTDARDAEMPLEDADLDLTDVGARDAMNRFEDESRHAEPGFEQRPNSKFLSRQFDPAQHDPNSEKQPRVLPTDREEVVEARRTQMRDAEAASNPHLHTHVHTHTHGRLPILTPGLHLAHHLPATSLLTPGLNLNINQQETIQPGVHPILPLHPFGINSVPMKNIIINTQASRVSEALTGPESHPGHPFYRPIHHHSPIHHPHKFDQHIPHVPVNRPHHTNFPPINHHGGPMVAEDILGQNPESFDGWAQIQANEERTATDDQDSPHINFRPPPMDDLDNNISPKHVKVRKPKNRPGAESNFWQIQTNRPLHQANSKEVDNFGPIEHHEREAEGVDQNEENLFARVASPTFKKKKSKKVKLIPIYLDQYPAYSSYYGYGPYREAETEPLMEDIIREGEDGSTSLEREASPTFKKKKLKKMKFIPIYYQQYPSYGSYYDDVYREADSNPELRDSEDEQDFSMSDREADPTHEKLQPYPAPQRDAEDVEDDILIEDLAPSSFDNREAEAMHRKKPKHKKWPKSAEDDGMLEENEDVSQNFDQDFPEDRDAGATHKKKRKHRFPHRSAEDPEEVRQSSGDLMSSNFLFNFPERRRFTDQFKRSLSTELDDLLGKHRKVVDHLERESQDDEDLKLVADISNRTLSDLEEKAKNVSKRSIPLTRLISDPNVRLDVPQTIENFGTVTKHAVEDERAPMYHLKQMIGSSRNALLSAMRIPPHNMIIPSDYEIVKTSELDPRRDSFENEDENDPFSQTFQRVGHMVRQSIKSGQDTAAHLGDMAHSARNVLNTARHSVPRLIVPYAQIPAIQDPKKKRPNKAILLTPRILDLAEENSHSARNAIESRPNFVRFGHLTDAVGISKPHSRNLDLQKIIFEPRRISEAKVNERLAQLYSKFRNHDDDMDTVGDAVSTLEDAKVSVGAQNLRDLLVKMKHELSDMVQSNPHGHKSRIVLKKQEEGKEMGKFIETLFDGTNPPKNGKVPESTKRERKKNFEDEGTEPFVGDTMFLPPELMHPFMGRPSQTEVKNFLRDNGDNYDLDHQKKPEVPRTSSHSNLNHSDLGPILGAINPLMFERLYHQTVTINNNDVSNLGAPQRHHEDGNDTVGIADAFGLTGDLKKPFMGQAQPQQIESLLDTYNRDEPDYIDLDE